MTEPATFDAAVEAVMDAYGRAAYDEALNLALTSRDRFPEHRARTTYWVACMHAMTGKPEDAVAELSAGLDRGDWWSDDLLRSDPDLISARDLPAFEEIARRASIAFAEHGRGELRPPIIERPAGEPSALLVVLHGGAGTAAETAPHWHACVAMGALLVVPESPYTMTSDDHSRRSWPSVEASVEILNDSLASVGSEAAETLPAVIGGFSQGGRIAAHLAIDEAPLRWDGAILFSPSLAADGAEGIVFRSPPRFWMFVGEDDGAFTSHAHRLSDELGAAGARVHLETSTGWGHDYPPDEDEHLRRAMTFVLP